jgi:hypothetical protein
MLAPAAADLNLVTDKCMVVSSSRHGNTAAGRKSICSNQQVAAGWSCAVSNAVSNAAAAPAAAIEIPAISHWSSNAKVAKGGSMISPNGTEVIAAPTRVNLIAKAPCYYFRFWQQCCAAGYPWYPHVRSLATALLTT